MSNIATAIKIQQATHDGIHDEETMYEARELLNNLTGGEMPSDEIIKALYRYSASLSANVATRITSILLTENEFDLMCDEIREFEQMEQDVLGE
jgi:hypothetical protein